MSLLNQPLFVYLKKHQQLAIFVGVIVASMMFLYAALGYTPKYQTEAKVIVRESVLMSKYLNTDDQVTTTSSTLTNPILNNLNLLKTTDVSDGLYDYMSSKHPEALAEKNIESKADWRDFFSDGSSYIKAKNLPGTDIISINFSWSKPEIAKEGLSTVLHSFQNASLKINQSEQLERATYLDAQAKELRTKLNALRTQVALFKKTHNTVNIEKETENYSRSRIEFDTQMKVAQAEAQAKQGEYNRYRSVIGMNPTEALRGTALGGDPTTAKLYDQLYTLKQQHAQYKNRYTDKHPLMKQLNAQISQLERDVTNQQKRSLGRAAGKRQVIIGDETRSGAVRNLVDASSQASALSIKAGLLNRYLKEIDSKMKNLPEIEATLQKFKDEENVLSTSLAVMEQKALEAKIRGSQSLSNIYIVDSPSMPRSASFPTQFHICILAVALGFVSGISVVLLKMKLEEVLGAEILVPVPSFGGLVASIRLGNSSSKKPVGTGKLPSLNTYRQY